MATELLPEIPQLQWNVVQGTYGDFVAPGTAVPVSYVLTYASLADLGTGNTRLTRDLLPVRELFDVGDLDFNELLQRDIDDHRVATEIIPYLLKPGVTARFFPPIIAVLVPSAGKRILDLYPACVTSRKTHPQAETHEVVRDSYGHCLEFERLRANGTYSRTATLRYNPDRSRLVVIDGQHRAMAMLAIRRTISGDWGDRGRDFKHFYEELASELNDSKLQEKLNNVELPVCICFFPTVVDDGTPKQSTTVQACRKLFLDVNKQAKKPTKARTLLLDDLDITSVLTRAILTRVRANAGQGAVGGVRIDLDSFEYDSPRDAPQPKRELAIVTVEMLREMVYWSTFGGDHFYTDLRRKPAGRLPKAQRERFLAQLRVAEEVSSKEQGTWGFQNIETELELDSVPTPAHARLADLYMGVWGNTVIRILANLHPFRSHVSAVAEVRDAHRGESGHAGLAWRALFDGQGIYWTLERYTLHRRRRRRELVKQLGKAASLPEVMTEHAYATIVDKWIPKEFKQSRARLFWMTKQCDDEQVRSLDRSFAVWRTMAFQVGVLMAFAYLKEKCALDQPQAFNAAVDIWIEAWNEVFTANSGRLQAFDRGDRDETTGAEGEEAGEGIQTEKKAGGKKRADGLMRFFVGRLQSVDWYWFRYFTFEYLAAAKRDFMGKALAREAAEESRWFYISSLEENIRKQQKQAGEKVSVENEPGKLARENWAGALKSSVGLTKAQFETWYKKGPQSAGPVDTAEPPDAETEDEIDDEAE
jgi:DNA-sulfur modification-associated